MFWIIAEIIAMRWRPKGAAFLAAHGERRPALELDGDDFEIRTGAVWTAKRLEGHTLKRRAHPAYRETASSGSLAPLGDDGQPFLRSASTLRREFPTRPTDLLTAVVLTPDFFDWYATSCS